MKRDNKLLTIFVCILITVLSVVVLISIVKGTKESDNERHSNTIHIDHTPDLNATEVLTEMSEDSTEEFTDVIENYSFLEENCQPFVDYCYNNGYTIESISIRDYGEDYFLRIELNDGYAEILYNKETGLDSCSIINLETGEATPIEW